MALKCSARSQIYTCLILNFLFALNWPIIDELDEDEELTGAVELHTTDIISILAIVAQHRCN